MSAASLKASKALCRAMGACLVVASLSWPLVPAADLLVERTLVSGTGRPGRIATSDIDADGTADMVFATIVSPSTIGWVENLGGAPAAFGAPRILHSVSAGGRSLSVGDLDGDGRPDIASAFIQGAATSTNLAWFENQGGATPSFVRRVISTATGDTETALGDLDGDGDLDIIGSSIAAGGHRWYENLGGATPSFSIRSVGAGQGFDEIEAADMDGDGDVDLTVVNSFVENVRWYENQGGAPRVFAERFAAENTGFRAGRLAIADLDRDGDRDIVAGALFGDPRTVWYDNLGGAPAQFSERLIDGEGARELAAFDTDADGDVDLLTTPNEVPNPLVHHQNLGAGSIGFARQVLLEDAPSGAPFAGADIDGDGILDPIALVETQSGDNQGRIVWFESLLSLLPVFIRETLVSFPDLDSAIAAAAAGQTIVAEPDAFGPLREVDRAVRFESTGGLRLEASFISILDDARFFAAPRASLEVLGQIAPSPAVRASFRARSLRLWESGRINLRVGSTLSFDLDFDTPNARCGGEISLSENSTLVFDGSVVLGSRGVPPRFQGLAAISRAGVVSAVPGDMDGDADVDLVVARPSATSVEWIENAGQGFPSWDSPRAISAAAGDAAKVEVVDLDADADRDVLVVAPLADRVVWHNSKGAAPPVFTERVLLSTLDGPVCARAADLDGNGALDVVVAGSGDATVVWLQSDGRDPPGFRTLVVARGSFTSGVQDVIAADLDGDGDLDVATAADKFGEVAWHENQTRGVFESRLIGAGLALACAVRAGDLDGDGDTDLVAAGGGGVIEWLANDGNAPARFSRQRLNENLASTCAIDLGDVDADGDPDVVFAAGAAASGNMAWIENRLDEGEGLQPIALPSPSTVSSRDEVRCADLDLDGVTDALVAGQTQTVWFRRVPSAPPQTLITAGATLASFSVTSGGTIENERMLRIVGGSVSAFETINRGTITGFGNFSRKLINEEAGSILVLADLQVGGDLENAGDITVANGTLTVLGTLQSTGTISGAIGGGGGAGVVDGGGVFAGEDWILAGDSSLLFPAGSRLALGGDFDAEIGDAARFDLAAAELRFAGVSEEQTIEAMSSDIGPDLRGLARGPSGYFPLGTLRIGPPAATVRVVDVHDNDGLGQERCEAIYTGTLHIAAGSTLENPLCRVYYREAFIAGEVTHPENLLPLADIRPFERGDVNDDGEPDLSDAVRLVLWLFGGAAQPGCLKAADASDDGRIGLDDAITLLNTLFRGAAELAAPSGACGDDPTFDLLTCTAAPSC